MIAKETEATCATHRMRLHHVDHGSRPICPACRAATASAERIEAARSTNARVDAIFGFGWRPRRQQAGDGYPAAA